jgi:hypothetical protein
MDGDLHLDFAFSFVSSHYVLLFSRFSDSYVPTWVCNNSAVIFLRQRPETFNSTTTPWPISNLRARLSISYDRHPLVVVVVVFSLGPSDLLDAIKTLDSHLARALASCKCCSASSRRLALLVTSLDAFICLFPICAEGTRWHERIKTAKHEPAL